MHLNLRSFFLIALIFGFYTTHLNANTIPQYKVKVATDLMNALKEARGILPGEKPYFFVVDSLPSKNFKVAMAYPSYGEIYFEESAYDLCVREFGADSLKAMSVILAHELVHFMRKHGVKNHFAWQFDTKFTQDSAIILALSSSLPEDEAASGFLTKVESLLKAFDTKKQEAEADLEGGFLSYLAGYPIGDVGPKLMDKIYSFYGIPAVLETYPTLAERRDIAVRTAEKLKDLQYWYEAANLLIVSGKYDNAIAIYKRLLGEFQGREIYNNMGVIYMLLADDLFTNNERPSFVIPYSLDVDTRLTDASRDAADIKMKRDSLLLLAISYFQKASELDGEYPLALLNEGCAQWLHSCSWVRDANQAAEYLAKAKGLALQTERLTRTMDTWAGQKRTIRSARILQAICLFSDNEKERALDMLNELKGQAPNDKRIETNIKVMQNPKFRVPPPAKGSCDESKPPAFSPASLDNTTVKTVHDYFNYVESSIEYHTMEPGERPYTMRTFEFGYSKQKADILVYNSFWTDSKDKTYQFEVMWAPRGSKELLPCREKLSNLDADQLESQYGIPKHTLPFARGELYFYPLFQADYADPATGKLLGRNQYALIVMVEDEKPVQWGLTFEYVPE
ncbi:MAG: M48 family metalloprotease [Saprospiraceae bacterium]|nr:M48 family metalloprotease [Saprospiraceae bacterium]